MGRKKKLINNTNIPQYAIERFARCVFDDIRADFAKPEVQADFQRWLAERDAKRQKQAKSVAFAESNANCEQHNKKKKRAASTAALSVYVCFFFLGPLGLDSGRMGAPLGKYSCSYLLK